MPATVIMAVLNREEAEVNTAIAQLHEDVRQAITSISSPAMAGEDRRAMQARIQSDMAKLRAKTRDLEMLAEEQETCVHLTITLLQQDRACIVNAVVLNGSVQS
jgi:hypothetical protein